MVISKRTRASWLAAALLTASSSSPMFASS